MLYEKNEIVKIREEGGKDGIYASFPCEEDNNYDYLLLEDIPNIVFIPEYMQSYKNAKCKKCCVSFSSLYDSSNPNNVKLIAKINDIASDGSVIELQTLVDKICLSTYQGLDLDQYDEIIRLKTDAINKISSVMFEQNGLLINSKYSFIGKIIDNNNNIVGIIDHFDVDIKDENNLSINLYNVVSYFALKDINVKTIEIPTGKCTLKINEFEIMKSDESMLRNYELKVKIAIVDEENSQDLIGVGNKPVIDDESFFDDYAKMLTKKEELFNKDETQNTIYGLFDDFDI